MKMLPMKADLFHADGWNGGRTDKHDKANSRFPQIRYRV